MRNLTRYIITRVLLTIPMVFILLSIVFVVLRVMPGDPVSAMLGGHAPESVIDQKKEEMGLNRPMVLQYADYLWQICRLDLGESMVFKQRVTKAIGEKLPATIELTFFGILITLFLGVFMGAYAMFSPVPAEQAPGSLHRPLKRRASTFSTQYWLKISRPSGMSWST